MTASAALLCLAMTVYGEARGEPLAGQVAVAQVVLNRMADPRWPDTVCGVVTQPGQFSFHWQAPREPSAWERAVIVARRALAGDLDDPTGGALYYHRKDLRLAWTAGLNGLLIGRQIFWRAAR